MTHRSNLQQTKRNLRLRIGRLRRRIDGRIRTAQRQGRRLISWRTYVEQYPGYAILFAMGAGLAASAGLRTFWSRYLGGQFVRWLVNRAVDLARCELREIWADSTPDRKTTETSGGEDGRP